MKVVNGLIPSSVVHWLMLTLIFPEDPALLLLSSPPLLLMTGLPPKTMATFLSLTCRPSFLLPGAEWGSVRKTVCPGAFLVRKTVCPGAFLLEIRLLNSFQSGLGSKLRVSTMGSIHPLPWHLLLVPQLKSNFLFLAQWIRRSAKRKRRGRQVQIPVELPRHQIQIWILYFRSSESRMKPVLRRTRVRVRVLFRNENKKFFRIKIIA
jgi:hypothetical protein